MSHVDPNPFASPAIPPPVAAAMPAGYPSRMEYMRSLNFIFENPNWATTVMWGFVIALASIIPGGGIIVQLLFLGYQMEVIESLLATRGTRYPDLDLSRFGEYFGRGVWPFLVNLVASLVLVPFILIAVFLPLMLAGAIGAAGGDDAAGVAMLIAMPLMMLLIFAVSIAAAAVLLPMMLRAGLTQNFAEGFNVGWAVDFAKRTWVEIVLAMLFLLAASLVLTMLGMLACFIGIYAAIVLIMLMQGHLMYQLYLVYLGRGGKPIPVKIAPAPPLAPQPQY
jgi:hypothetical protein